MVSRAFDQVLSPRDLDLLRMIVGQMSDSEIAFVLDISLETVVTLVRDLLEKITVPDRGSAAAKAIKSGWIKI